MSSVLALLAFLDCSGILLEQVTVIEFDGARAAQGLAVLSELVPLIRRLMSNPRAGRLHLGTPWICGASIVAKGCLSLLRTAGRYPPCPKCALEGAGHRNHV